MGGITIIFDILSVSRVWKTVLEAHLLHDFRLADLLDGLVERLAAALGRPRQRDERVRLAFDDALDSGAGVEASGEGASCGLDGGDGGRGCARHDDVDGLFERAGAAGEELHAVFGLVDAARLGQFAHGDGTSRVDTALVNPFLNTFEVHGGEFDRESVN